MNTRTYHLVSFGCALGAGLLTRKSLQRAWESQSGRRAPTDPSDPDVAWSEALAFGAAAGLLVGIARALARGAVPAASRSMPRRRFRRLAARAKRLEAQARRVARRLG